MRNALARESDPVFAQIEAGNDPSIRLHEKFGFERVGSRRVFVLE